MKKIPKSPYAIISNKFRAAVERCAFQNLEIKSHELDTFVRMLTPSRQRYLRSLQYSIVLPPVDEAVARRLERPAETEAVSRLFSFAMKRLFEAPHRLNGIRDIRLYLDDVGYPNEIRRPMCGRDDELGDYRFLRTRINLLEVDTLPQLTCISHLIFSSWLRTPNPSVQLELAARMTGLQRIMFVLDNFEMRYLGLLRDDRSSLATTLRLHLERTTSISTAIIDMNMNGGLLTKLNINGVFDGALFWPHASETAVSPTKWRNLQILKVQLEQHTPSGWWYFMPEGNPIYGTPARNPAEDANDYPPSFTDGDNESPYDIEAERYWNMRNIDDVPREDMLIRNTPNEDAMQPLFEAWAKALRCMPYLKGAKLTFRVSIPMNKPYEEEYMYPVDWEIVYEAPDFTHSDWGEELLPEKHCCRRLILHNTCGWRPRQSTIDLLQHVGEESYLGTEMMLLVMNQWGKVVRNGQVSTA
ncbi:hypothetical protein PT974_11126 [Cladobotryum mycophilum]|uniref:Uncharacterized protein n=1 Tax=Cladobotryum mycophilum TaxID=491253 RepID=A0ABR0S4B1_9HYPO